MTFTVRSMNWDFKEEAQINTIEDLKKLYDRFDNNELIIDFDKAIITIYDSYIA